MSEVVVVRVQSLQLCSYTFTLLSSAYTRVTLVSKHIPATRFSVQSLES